MTLEINASPVTTYDVKIVGEMVKVKPLKTAFAMHLIGVQDKIKKEPKKFVSLLNDMIDGMFDKPGAKRIRARLNDGHDALDVDHLFDLMSLLMEQESANPTT